MYRLGYIGSNIELCQEFFNNTGKFETVSLFGYKTKAEVLSAVLDNQIDVLLVDYNIEVNFPFSCADLVCYLNIHLYDLGCFVLADSDGQSLGELISSRDIISKAIMGINFNSTDRDELISVLANSASVYRNRLQQKVERYNGFLRLKQSDCISLYDEEEFFQLYRILRSYKLIDELPGDMLKSNFSVHLDNLMGVCDRIIGSLQKELDSE